MFLAANSLVMIVSFLNGVATFKSSFAIKASDYTAARNEPRGYVLPGRI
jgi:hypothetical protein